MFFDPNPTPYDLNFRLFGIPVRVHPLFWLVGFLMGANSLNLGFEYLLVWMIVLFVSILIHELGHVWMGLVYGSNGYIVLWGLGGLAIGSNTQRSAWKRIAVCLAGPMAGFIFLGCILVGVRWGLPDYFPVLARITLGYFGLEDLVAPPADPRVAFRMFQEHLLLYFALQQLVWINLLWGLVNLLPIWPLDGGQISRDLLRMASPASGIRISLGISFVTAALISLHSFMCAAGHPLIPFLPIGDKFTGIFFAVFALQSFMLLQHTQRQRRWDDGTERDPDIWGP